MGYSSNGYVVEKNGTAAFSVWNQADRDFYRPGRLDVRGVPHRGKCIGRLSSLGSRDERPLRRCRRAPPRDRRLGGGGVALVGSIA